MDPFSSSLAAASASLGKLKCVWVRGADGRLESIWVPDWEQDCAEPERPAGAAAA
ncbi:MAG: hypothetical protein QOJ23_6027 [Actinomycetota bacterium]|nr:hypothetical protein [Actinomycetota bacterium]